MYYNVKATACKLPKKYKENYVFLFFYFFSNHCRMNLIKSNLNFCENKFKLSAA